MRLCHHTMNMHQKLKKSVVTLICIATPLAICLAAPRRGGPENTILPNAVEIIGSVDPDATNVPDVSGPVIWKDPSQPVDARVQDLVSRMTLAEKASQLMADAPPIPRLGIPSYSYRNEAAHGVADDGIATVFPQSIGMAATWDASLIHQEGDVVATEGRAKFNDYADSHNGNSIIHHGITFYAPNINIFRDPRWGRGQETFGEDPFLTSQLGVAYITGMQGDNPKYIKVLACAKHFAVHSGPEDGRSHFNITPPEQDLYDTYLVAFRAAVQQGHVGSIMGSYNALYGVPNCANPFLLTDILRDKWGFDGYVVSDGGAIHNIWVAHKYVATPEEAAAAAVKAGCNLFSATFAGGKYPHNDYVSLGDMLNEKLLTEQQIDDAITRTLTERFKLGLFDPPQDVPWSSIKIDQNDTPEHQALALKVAEESIVLLKNDGLLPLDRSKIKRIAVIGSNADADRMLYGNYNGTASHPITILDGIKAVAGSNIQVTYAVGCPLAISNDGSNKPTSQMTADAIADAKAADLVIYVGGLNQDLECEEHNVQYQGFNMGDRTRIELPPPQEDLIKSLHDTGKPVIFVNCTGSAIAMPWEAKHLAAIVQAWYSGEQGGQAVGEVLFGDVNPAGRLPITVYKSTSDLPDFTDYSMKNRTYRYYEGKPLFAFGYGLSYTSFEYSDAKLADKNIESDDTMHVSFTIKNTGDRDGDEVAQVYYRNLKPAISHEPKKALCGFTRVHIAKGNSADVTIDIPAQQFRHWDTKKKEYVVDTGNYELLIGGASDNVRLKVPVKVGADD
jgi:beta-glucosidase